MNRKSGKYLSVYWFTILFIVAGGITYMVYSFYGKPYDAREVEAGLLTDKIADCLSQGGYINEAWQSLNDNNLLDKCGLDFNVEASCGWSDDQYYIEIEIANFDSGETLKQASAGNQNLKPNCAIQDSNFPVCLERNIYSLDKANKQYNINILSIVRKTEKNAQSNC